MGLSLYEINDQLRILEEWQINPETGELLSVAEFNKLFDKIQMDLNSKIENTICFAKTGCHCAAGCLRPRFPFALS